MKAFKQGGSDEDVEELTIYIGETDHWHDQPLYMALVEVARQHGIIGAT
ncbi:MAG TPA: DUF190 domain-containing protein [Coleofasciculaceae cyanobacterium]